MAWKFQQQQTLTDVVVSEHKAIKELDEKVLHEQYVKSSKEHWEEAYNARGVSETLDILEQKSTLWYLIEIIKSIFNGAWLLLRTGYLLIRKVFYIVRSDSH